MERLKALWWAFLLAVFLLSGSAFARPATRLTFAMKTDQSAALYEVVSRGMRNIYVSGTISNGDTERFLHFVSLRKLGAARVVLNSPGGSLLEGVKLGRAIRQLRFFTDVGDIADGYGKSNSICASACAYAFAGGVSRFLSDSSGKLGIHQFRSVGAGLSEADAQLVSGMLVSYLHDMGVDTEAFAVASATQPNGITWLTPKEAQQLGFANNGIEPTTADIKVAEMHPYLRLNQEQYDITIRVLFLCEDKALDMMAGIVSDPEQSRDTADARWQKRSYVEFDRHEELVVNGAAGAKANESAIWLNRPLSSQEAQSILQTDALGVWVDGFGAVRFGGTIDLTKVRPVIKDYFAQCLN